MDVFVGVNNAKKIPRLAAAQFSAEASVSGHGQKSPKMSGFQIKPHLLLTSQVDFEEWKRMREKQKIAVEKRGGGACERIVKGDRRSMICAMQIAW